MTTLPPHLRPRLTASVSASLSASRPALASRLLSIVDAAINGLPAASAAALVDALAVGDLAALRAAAAELPRLFEGGPFMPAAEAVWTRILAELAGDRLADVERARAAETEAALALSAACIGWPIDRDRLDAARLAFDQAMRDCAAAEARYAAAT